MPRVLKAAHARKGARFTAALVIAGLAVVAVAGLAVAKSLTLKVSKGVHVDNSSIPVPKVKAVNKHEAVAVGSLGYAVYTFQGETTHHIICKKAATSSGSCWQFWPPVSVSAAKGLSAQKGIKGKLGTFMNQGLRQVTLGGKPLYYFQPDISAKNKKQAMGDELKTFGSTWHIVTVGKAKSTNNPPQQGGGLPPGY